MTRQFTRGVWPRLTSQRQLRQLKLCCLLVCLEQWPTHTKQLLHLEAFENLMKQPLWRREQALFEWMIEPKPDIQGGYPFPVGLSEVEAKERVSTLKQALDDGARSSIRPVQGLVDTEGENELFSDAPTKKILQDWDRRQFQNFKNIRLRLESAAKGGIQATRPLAILLGSFEGGPLQGRGMRLEVAWQLLDDPPAFLCEKPASSEGLNLSAVPDATTPQAPAMAAKSPSSERPECPFDLSKLTSGQKERVEYIWANKPTPKELRDYFDLSVDAWDKARTRINEKALGFEIQNKNGRYNLVEKTL